MLARSETHQASNTNFAAAIQARHMPALDGFRAVAVFSVISFHGGYLYFLDGVTAFFVLSGFLITTLLLTGFATVAVGLVPTYATIGIWGAVLLTFIRLVQGIGVGGEWGGSVLLAMEWSRTTKNRGLISAWPQFGGPAGQPQVIDYIAWLRMTPLNFNTSDPITANLQVLNVATAGALKQHQAATTKFVPLLTSSSRISYRR